MRNLILVLSSECIIPFSEMGKGKLQQARLNLESNISLSYHNFMASELYKLIVPVSLNKKENHSS
jgi:hypothetical protein